MKLSSDFVTFRANDEVMLVAKGGADFSGLVKGNEALGDVLELLQKDITEADLIAAMLERYDATEEVLAKDIGEALAQLRAIGALEG